MGLRETFKVQTITTSNLKWSQGPDMEHACNSSYSRGWSSVHPGLINKILSQVIEKKKMKKEKKGKERTGKEERICEFHLKCEFHKLWHLLECDYKLFSTRLLRLKSKNWVEHKLPETVDLFMYVPTELFGPLKIHRHSKIFTC